MPSFDKQRLEVLSEYPQVAILGHLDLLAGVSLESGAFVNVANVSERVVTKNKSENGAQVDISRYTTG